MASARIGTNKRNRKKIAMMKSEALKKVADTGRNRDRVKAIKELKRRGHWEEPAAA